MAKLNEKQLEIANQIITKYKESNKKNIIIVCIGTPKSIGDSLGPLVGTRLQENEIKITVKGDLEDPIHALNVQAKMQEIKEQYNDPFIIGVDSCVAYDREIGYYDIKDTGISPGKGVGKDLCKVGDCGLYGIVHKCDEKEDYDDILFCVADSRKFKSVYLLSTILTNILMHVDKVLAKKLLINRMFYK